ncbi:MAG TPA: DUF5318 family protein [Acidimicrobiales bacterium]|nr:DUF5318 family protein [Acidimicrobiales bacterium]
MRPEPEFVTRRYVPTGLGQIEYRLVRDSVVREFRRGRLSRLEVCDAHPELMRVARNLGRATEVDCPICDESKLVHVAFAFGPRLPPGGRALRMDGEMRALARQRDDVAFYIVEVCTQCSWNHLLRMFPAPVARARLFA